MTTQVSRMLSARTAIAAFPVWTAFFTLETEQNCRSKKSTTGTSKYAINAP